MHIRKEEKMFGLFNKKNTEIEKEIKEIVLRAFHFELEEIKEWNEETFPDATLSGQLAKLEEEFKELSEAKEEDKMKEFADVFIVLGGLRRWESKIGNCIVNTMIENMPISILLELLPSIKTKMDINRKRVWKKSGDGKFHHTNKE